MAKKIQRNSVEFPVEKPSPFRKCIVCGSDMILVSSNPDVWYCPKCGAKRVSER